MLLLLKLSWRNIQRNWRRTIITILAIVFAVFLSIVMNGLQVGTYESNIRLSLEMFSGHIQVQKNTYQSNPTLAKSFFLTDELISALESHSEITGYAPRIVAGGLVGYKGNSVGAIIMGMSPEREKKVCKIAEKVNQGSFLDNEYPDKVVVGYRLLNILKMSIGDTIVILTTGYDGSMGNQKFVVGGTFKLGSPEIDRMGVFVDINAMDELVSMYGRVNIVALSVKNFDRVEETIVDIREEIRDTSLAIMNWEGFMPELKQWMEFDNAQNMLYLGLLVILVAFGILNTILMSITERFREFGIMLALGIKNSYLVLIVFLEVLIITFIGLIIGNIMAFGVNFYIVNNPILLSGDYAKAYEEYGFVPKIFSSVNWKIFVSMSAGVLGIALLTFIYPMYRIMKLEALKGIRYT